MVRAESATRRRTPGGSSIWPNTSAAFSNTPDSSISMRKSVPSRVRSPTPANTDTPPWFDATRLIISVMRTVLPTPAPPNKPIFPPARYGVSKSMTLMPVSNMRRLGSSAAKSGAGRWISQRSASLKSSLSPSRQSPHTFHTCPRVLSPTGTVMPWPVLRTGVPRRKPSVGFKHTARTRLWPSCCATSANTLFGLPSTITVNSSAWFNSGRAPRGNSTSITGPAIATTRPSFNPVVAVAVLIMCSYFLQLLRGLARAEGLGTANDFHDFCGD